MSDEEEKEFDYGDELKSDDEQQYDSLFSIPDEPEYKDSYRQLEQVGRAMRHGEMDILRTEVEGGPRLQLTPTQEFSQEVSRWKRQLSNRLNENDNRILMETISKLYIIPTKSPLLYVLGYIMFPFIRSNRLWNDKYRLVKGIAESERIRESDVYRFARVWRLVLLDKDWALTDIRHQSRVPVIEFVSMR